jgi:hypothetical protein
MDGKSKQKLAVLTSELLDVFGEVDRDGNGNGDGGGSVKKKSAVESSPAFDAARMQLFILLEAVRSLDARDMVNDSLWVHQMVTKNAKCFH